MKRILFVALLIAVLLCSCDDGIDRSGFPATATASVKAELELAATLTPEEGK